MLSPLSAPKGKKLFPYFGKLKGMIKGGGGGEVKKKQKKE